jgi:hypothetical protein
MYRHETDLHQRVQKFPGLADDVSNQTTRNHELHMGMRSLPVFPERLQSIQQVGNVRSVDPELLYGENKLGCARGVFWAFALEAALLIAIAIFWKLRFFLR